MCVYVVYGVAFCYAKDRPALRSPLDASSYLPRLLLSQLLLIACLVLLCEPCQQCRAPTSSGAATQSYMESHCGLGGKAADSRAGVQPPTLLRYHARLAITRDVHPAEDDFLASTCQALLPPPPPGVWGLASLPAHQCRRQLILGTIVPSAPTLPVLQRGLRALSAVQGPCDGLRRCHVPLPRPLAHSTRTHVLC